MVPSHRAPLGVTEPVSTRDGAEPRAVPRHRTVLSHRASSVAPSPGWYRSCECPQGILSPGWYRAGKQPRWCQPAPSPGGLGGTGSFGHPQVAPSPGALAERGAGGQPWGAGGHRAWRHPGWHQAGEWHCQGCTSPWRMSLVVGAMGHDRGAARRLCHHRWAGASPPLLPASSILGISQLGERCCAGAGGAALPRGGLVPSTRQAGLGQAGARRAGLGGTEAALLPPGSGDPLTGDMGTHRPWVAQEGVGGRLRAPPQGQGTAPAPGSPRPCPGSSWPASPRRVL